MEKGRRIYLLFSRAWGGEDLEDNGIGVCYINEKIGDIFCFKYDEHTYSTVKMNGDYSAAARSFVRVC